MNIDEGPKEAFFDFEAPRDLKIEHMLPDLDFSTNRRDSLSLSDKPVAKPVFEIILPMGAVSLLSAARPPVPPDTYVLTGSYAPAYGENGNRLIDDGSGMNIFNASAIGESMIPVAIPGKPRGWAWIFSTPCPAPRASTGWSRWTVTTG